jgi:hypothetical protein
MSTQYYYSDCHKFTSRNKTTRSVAVAPGVDEVISLGNDATVFDSTEDKELKLPGIYNYSVPADVELEGSMMSMGEDSSGVYVGSAAPQYRAPPDNTGVGGVVVYHTTTTSEAFSEQALLISQASSFNNRSGTYSNMDSTGNYVILSNDANNLKEVSLYRRTVATWNNINVPGDVQTGKACDIDIVGSDVYYAVSTATTLEIAIDEGQTNSFVSQQNITLEGATSYLEFVGLRGNYVCAINGNGDLEIWTRDGTVWTQFDVKTPSSTICMNNDKYIMAGGLLDVRIYKPITSTSWEQYIFTSSDDITSVSCTDNFLAIGQADNGTKGRTLVYTFTGVLLLPNVKLLGTVSIENLESEISLFYDSTVTKSLSDNTGQGLTNFFRDSVDPIIPPASGDYTIDYDTGIFNIINPGYYRVDCEGRFASNATGYRKLSIFVNSVETYIENVNAISGVATTVHISRVIYFDTSDSIEMEALQNSGGPLILDEVIFQLQKVSA